MNFSVAVALAVFAVSGAMLPNIKQNNTQTANVTVFAVEMDTTITIWQNDKQTNQTFFMDGSLNQLGAMSSHKLYNDFEGGFPFPFLNNFTINNQSFVAPTTGDYNFGASGDVQGHIRSNFYYGPLQFIEPTLSLWHLYRLDMSSKWDEFMIKKYSNIFVS